MKPHHSPFISLNEIPDIIIPATNTSIQQLVDLQIEPLIDPPFQSNEMIKSQSNNHLFELAGISLKKAEKPKASILIDDALAFPSPKTSPNQKELTKISNLLLENNTSISKPLEIPENSYEVEMDKKSDDCEAKIIKNGT